MVLSRQTDCQQSMSYGPRQRRNGSGSGRDVCPCFGVAAHICRPLSVRRRDQLRVLIGDRLGTLARRRSEPARASRRLQSGRVLSRWERRGTNYRGVLRPPARHAVQAIYQVSSRPHQSLNWLLAPSNRPLGSHCELAQDTVARARLEDQPQPYRFVDAHEMVIHDIRRNRGTSLSDTFRPDRTSRTASRSPADPEPRGTLPPEPCT